MSDDLCPECGGEVEPGPQFGSTGMPNDFADGGKIPAVSQLGQCAEGHKLIRPVAGGPWAPKAD